ncbi:predicted protein [Naegleria gruberi]|uniref:Predicted protein n=1 Tax=Naegleria gruberi TaxID=5762 RepID=D2VJ14_NAEGR|nr:uncharacterized protein NAEGRDRAFT_58356 [Naegleria gruberi]EFC43196.1 predicted protein [Naegleria gruberi]|eukprot:XP_002675940.1 predicted protein [Naegleria gruberi strain NEG-M]
MSATNSSSSNGKTMILLRGISGSGKSTLASEIMKNHGIDYTTGYKDHIFSTDDYFVDPQTGNYNFDATQLGKAHQWNQKRASDAMKNGTTPIIIDNTNTQKWEAKPYVVAAKANSYVVEITEPTTPWAKNAQELAKRNKHGVPLVAIERMLERWEIDFTVEKILASQPPKRK